MRSKYYFDHKDKSFKEVTKEFQPKWYERIIGTIFALLFMW